VLLGYGVAGIIAFLIMRQLGEMVVEEPVSGSFAHFAFKYWGPFAGFLSGWNYWAMFVLVGMAELTAAGIYMQYWFPDVPTWIWAAAFFIIINAVNLVNVRLYGETEFWFALIKVLAIIGMIGFGLWMLFGGHGGESQLRQSLVSRRFLRHRLERPDPLPCGDYVFLRRPGTDWYHGG
jgi:phenylalanine-specific permease